MWVWVYARPWAGVYKREWVARLRIWVVIGTLFKASGVHRRGVWRHRCAGAGFGNIRACTDGA